MKKSDKWLKGEESYFTILVKEHLGNPCIRIVNRTDYYLATDGSYEHRSTVSMGRSFYYDELLKHDCLIDLAQTVAVGVKALESKILQIIKDEETKKLSDVKKSNKPKPKRRTPSNKLIE